jgi:phosphatidylglycerophosphatase C
MDDIQGSAVPDVAAEAAQRVVLFDFDGVLLRGDAFYEFVRARLRRSIWRFVLVLLVLPFLALPLLLKPLRWGVIGVLVRIAFLGVNERRYRELAIAFARELAERKRIFIREGILAMRRHIAEGDRVIVVTGCEQTLVSAIFAQIGLPDIECVGSRLRPGFLGMRKEMHNFGMQKPRQVRAYGISAPWDVAYTDSPVDAPMLRDARDPVLVNGSPGACKALERKLGRPLRHVDWY